MTEKGALTIKEAAKYSSIGLNELRWQAKNNPKFPAFKIGERKILIYKDKFDAWLSELASKRTGFKN